MYYEVKFPSFNGMKGCTEPNQEERVEKYPPHNYSLFPGSVALLTFRCSFEVAQYYYAISKLLVPPL